MKKVEVTEDEVLEFENLEAVTVGAGQFLKLAVNVWRARPPRAQPRRLPSAPRARAKGRAITSVTIHESVIPLTSPG